MNVFSLRQFSSFSLAEDIGALTVAVASQQLHAQRLPDCPPDDTTR
jgi:hypothetical protein